MKAINRGTRRLFPQETHVLYSNAIVNQTQISPLRLSALYSYKTGCTEDQGYLHQFILVTTEDKDKSVSNLPATPQ